MKMWQYGVFAGLIVLLLGAGALLLQQRAELETWKGRALNAESAATRHATAQATAEKSARDAEEKVATLETQLVAAHASPAAAPAPAKTPGRETAATDEKITADTVKQWLADANDPAVLRRLNIQARNQTLRRYAALFTELNLPADQTEALTKLLTDKRQAGMDLVVSQMQQGAEDPTKDMDGLRDAIITSRIELENQIHAQLGDAGYAQYQAYDRNFGQMNVMKNLETTLLGTAEPLTTEQVARMTQLLQANNATRITAPVLTGAKDILSPVQMQALQDMRAIQLANSQKRLQPGQVLPTAPAAPAKKP